MTLINLTRIASLAICIAALPLSLSAQNPPALVVQPQKSGDVPTKGLYVTVHLVVDEDGNATKIKVQHSAGSPWDQKAIDAVQKYHFPPTLNHGKPVKVDVDIRVNFSASSPATPPIPKAIPQ